MTPAMALLERGTNEIKNHQLELLRRLQAAFATGRFVIPPSAMCSTKSAENSTHNTSSATGRIRNVRRAFTRST